MRYTLVSQRFVGEPLEVHNSACSDISKKIKNGAYAILENTTKESLSDEINYLIENDQIIEKDIKHFNCCKGGEWWN